MLQECKTLTQMHTVRMYSRCIYQKAGARGESIRAFRNSGATEMESQEQPLAATVAIAQLLGYFDLAMSNSADRPRKRRFDDVLAHVSNALQSHEDIRSFALSTGMNSTRQSS